MQHATMLPSLTAREKSGLTLQQIAETTKITLSNLMAIERGDFNKLPGGIYSTSYIRQYARAIGYDEFELLEQYHLLTGAPPTIPQMEMVENSSLRGFKPLLQH